MRQTEFGVVLRQLLDLAAPRLGVPRRNMASTLADGIKTDRTLVYRWLRHTHVPSLRSRHVANIAEFLELDGVTAARLERAQISSLQAGAHGPAISPRTHDRVNEAMHELVGPRTIAPPVVLAPLTRTPKVAHSAAVAVVRGRTNVLRAVIAALDETPACRPSGARAIVISTQGAEPWWALPGEPKLHQHWKLALRGVLHRGWPVRQIWRLQQVARTIRLVETMLDLAGFEGYQPGYFTQYGLLQPPYDFLVIPGRVAFHVFGTGESEEADTAFIFRDPAHVRLIEAYTQQQIAQTTEFFQRFHGADQELTFTRAMVASESQPGGRRLVMDGLSALTLPPAWFEEDTHLARRLVQTASVSATDLSDYLALLNQRWAEFERRVCVPSNAHYFVCPRRAVEQMIDAGRYPADEPFFRYQVAPPLVLEHLRHVLTMLHRFEHYHLALVDDDTARAFSAQTTWGVDGIKAYLAYPFHTADALGKPEQLNLQISEPTITRAFRDYFDMLWRERIAEHEKDRRDTIAWLEARVRMLEERG